MNRPTVGEVRECLCSYCARSGDPVRATVGTDRAVRQLALLSRPTRIVEVASKNRARVTAGPTCPSPMRSYKTVTVEDLDRDWMPTS
jgi:hypothetical protein